LTKRAHPQLSQPSPKTYNKETDHERTTHAKYRLQKNTPRSGIECVVPTEGDWGRIELKGRPAFANVSKLGMRLDVIFDPNTKRRGGVDTSNTRQHRDEYAGEGRASVDVRKTRKTVHVTTHSPGFAGLEPSVCTRPGLNNTNRWP
jgi:hypothetical protein